jgi:hypothetical protein
VATSPRRFAALDTQFLLELENGNDQCTESIDILRKLGFYFIVTATALQEIEDISTEDADAQVAAHARNTLRSITNWGFIDPPLSPVLNGVAEIVGTRLIERKILPSELKNDGMIIAEAACHNCQIFLTPRKQLWEAKFDSLRLALIECDVAGLVVVSPAELIAYFRKVI